MPNGLLDVLCTPHIHAIVVPSQRMVERLQSPGTSSGMAVTGSAAKTLTRLVPPTLGDGEKTSEVRRIYSDQGRACAPCRPASAHARHDVAAIFEPIEEKCPVEPRPPESVGACISLPSCCAPLPHAASDHHLHTNGIVVDFPGVRIQDGYQRNDHASDFQGPPLA